MQIRLILIIGAVLVLTLQVIAQEPERRSGTLPENVKVTRDLVYAKYGDRSLRLDLYEPAKRDKSLLPSVVVIRGGGWRSGDKEGYGPIAAALANRGLAAVSIEMRASGEAKFPAAVQDTKAAVRWLRSNARKYRLEPAAIGAIGGSSGGHLAVYLGVTRGVAKLEGAGGNQESKSFVSAIVGMAPPANLSVFGGLGGDANSNPLIRFIGDSYKNDPDLWKFASPISHVAKSSPPLLLIHSGADRTVPYSQSVELASRYGKVGAPVELVLIPAAPHAFWNYKKWFKGTMDRSAAFFWTKLGKSRA